MRFVLDFRLVTFVSLATLVFATAAWIVSSPHFTQNPDALALAVTMDMVIILPAVFYFWIVRKRRLPTLAFVPAFILAIVIAGIILPAAQQTYLDLVKKFIPLLEVLVLGFLVIKIRAINQHYRANKMTAIYSTEALAASFQRVLGASRPTNILVAELLLLYHAFGGWFKKFTSRDPEQAVFSYHRRVGYTAIMCVVTLILLVETTALHLLLLRWSALAAWIFTGLSLYSLLWLIGDYHAIRLHPIVLDETHLHLRIGMRWRATIPLNDIAEIQNPSRREKNTTDCVSLALFGSPRLVMALRQPVKIKGLFGIQKETRRLALTIDDEKRFQQELNERLNRKRM
jgi:hypothetical protein